MSTEPATAPRSSSSSLSGGWVRPVILAASCLVLGFVVGWVLRGDGGRAVVLPPATSQETSTATTPTIGTAPRAARAPAAPVDRSGVAVAVLNASDVTGLAGQTGDRAVRLGYARANLVVGNAPPQSGGSVVYYRAGSRTQARQVAKDLEVGRVAPIPAGTSLTGQTPGAAQSDVIVVLAG
jgi:hypothetical protein